MVFPQETCQAEGLGPRAVTANWAVEASQGDTAGWENRRFYLGAGAELFHQLFELVVRSVTR